MREAMAGRPRGGVDFEVPAHRTTLADSKGDIVGRGIVERVEDERGCFCVGSGEVEIRGEASGIAGPQLA